MTKVDHDRHLRLLNPFPGDNKSTIPTPHELWNHLSGATNAGFEGNIEKQRAEFYLFYASLFGQPFFTYLQPFLGTSLEDPKNIIRGLDDLAEGPDFEANNRIKKQINIEVSTELDAIVIVDPQEGNELLLSVHYHGGERAFVKIKHIPTRPIPYVIDELIGPAYLTRIEETFMETHPNAVQIMYTLPKGPTGNGGQTLKAA